MAVKVGEHEAETILWLNFLSERDVKAIEDVREFYGQPSVIEEARELDQLEQLEKLEKLENMFKIKNEEEE